MTTKTIITTAGILIIASSVVGFFTGKKMGGKGGAGNDSPITIADGSVRFHRQKFKKDSDVNYSVSETNGQVTSIQCPKCETNTASYTLDPTYAWKLEINGDGTYIQQDPQNTANLQIHLYRAPDDDKGDLVFDGSYHLKSASLVYQNGTQTFKCPLNPPANEADKCKIHLHYSY